MDDLTARYEAWREARIRLNWREDDAGGGPPSPSEWERSDDEANALLAEFADAWADREKPTVYVLDELTTLIREDVAAALADGDGGCQLAIEIDDDGCHARVRFSPWAAWQAPETLRPA